MLRARTVREPLIRRHHIYRCMIVFLRSWVLIVYSSLRLHLSEPAFSESAKVLGTFRAVVQLEWSEVTAMARKYYSFYTSAMTFYFPLAISSYTLTWAGPAIRTQCETEFHRFRKSVSLFRCLYWQATSCRFLSCFVLCTTWGYQSTKFRFASRSVF
jgi:hypothetical protein